MDHTNATMNTNPEDMEEKVTFAFNADDTEALEMLCSELGVTEEDFFEKRAFNGEGIKKVITVLIKIIKSPSKIDDFIAGEGREVTFDADGNLLMAKGYTASEVLDLKRSKHRLYEPKNT